MSEVARVRDVDFRKNLVFVTNYYDHPLAGLCRWRGELCRFEREYMSDWYTVYSLTWQEKVRRLWRKALFEFCIGKHQTYRNGQKSGFYYTRNPKWFWRLMHKVYFAQKIRRFRRSAPPQTREDPRT